jgi:hypothetical protein
MSERNEKNKMTEIQAERKKIDVGVGKNGTFT